MRKEPRTRAYGTRRSQPACVRSVAEPTIWDGSIRTADGNQKRYEELICAFEARAVSSTARGDAELPGLVPARPGFGRRSYASRYCPSRDSFSLSISPNISLRLTWPIPRSVCILLGHIPISIRLLKLGSSREGRSPRGSPRRRRPRTRQTHLVPFHGEAATGHLAAVGGQFGAA